MALAIFQQMTNTVLAVLGENALLRGTLACRVNIEHGVQVTGEDGMTVLERSIATIPSSVNPKVGDALMHPEGTYRLEVQTANNGHSKRFILLPVES